MSAIGLLRNVNSPGGAALESHVGGTSLCKQGHSYSAAEGEIGQYCRQSIVPGAVVPVTADRGKVLPISEAEERPNPKLAH